MERQEGEKDEGSEKWRENRCFPPFGLVEMGRKSGASREFSFQAYTNVSSQFQHKMGEKSMGGWALKSKDFLTLPFPHCWLLLFSF